MLTAADEWHVHQTPEPIAVAGTDRNFYDRSYLGGYSPDGDLFVAAAFGVYPHLNIADAHVTIVRDGRQHSLHASRFLGMDRSDLSVGPVRIEILEPLHRIRLVVAEHEGIEVDVTFEGRAAAFLEPRFVHRMGPRTFMDYTRMSQTGRLSGHVAVDGERHDLPAGSHALRDRSWGVRPVGASDAQPLAPPAMPSFFWAWAPVHLGDRTTFFHVCSDVHGRPWNTRARFCGDGAAAEDHGEGEGAMDVDLLPGTRWARSATIRIAPDAGRAGTGGGATTLAYEPITRLQMRGLGYGHPTWAHGTFHGELATEREDLVLDEVDPAAPHEFHVQALCRVTATDDDGGSETGIGLLEQFVMGPYAPYGLAAMDDVVA